MGASLYDTDILAWAEAQADRLRRMAAGERVNDLDWAHVIEEIEDLGLSELRRVEGLLRQAFLHGLKILCYPGHPAIPHWRQEVATFLDQARDRFQPGMAQRIDLAEVYARARRGLLRDPLDDATPLPPPDSLPLDVRAVLSDGFSRDALLRALADAQGTRP